MKIFSTIKKNILIQFFSICLLNFGCKDYNFNNPVDTNVELKAPYNLTINSVSETEVNLSWNDDNTYGSHSDKVTYEIEQSSDNEHFSVVKNVSVNLKTAKVEGNFISNLTYHFRVRIKADSRRTSCTENYTSFSFPAPTDLEITSVSDTEVNLKWQLNNAFAEYIIIEKSIKPDSEFKKADSAAAGIKTRTVKTNISKDTTYYFRIYAKSKINRSGNSNVIPLQLQFKAPSDLTAQLTTETLLNLTWRDNSNCEINFVIEQSTDGANFNFLKLIPANSTSAQIDGVYLINQNYYFRINAKSSNNESGFSNTASARLTFNAPSNTTVNFSSDMQADLSWTDNSTFEKSFEVEQSKDGLSFNPVKSVTANNNSTQLQGTFLTTENYYFRVKAKAQHNESGYSNIVRAGLQFPEPTNLNVQITSASEAVLSWTDNSNFETGFEIEQGSDGISFSLIKTAASNTTNTTITGNYVAGNDYYFRIRSKSTHNYSKYSAQYKTARTSCGGITTVSYEGKIYNTVAIGNQCWLKENLDAGIQISSGSGNQINNQRIEKYCYKDNSDNCATYGGLYTWGEAMGYSLDEKARGICPEGWHIPNLTELQQLGAAAKNNANELLAVGQGSGTNSTGFSALLSGCTFIDEYGGKSFGYLGERVGIYSSTQYWTGASWRHYFLYLGGSTNINYTPYFTNCYSVRCLKD